MMSLRWRKAVSRVYGSCVVAKATDSEPAMVAMGRLNAELFDRRCEDLGATTEPQRAALLGVNASTLWRFRKGEIGPRLEVARRFAQILGVTVDELWPEAKS